jgi:uracil-DNA glycosylase
MILFIADAPTEHEQQGTQYTGFNPGPFLGGAGHEFNKLLNEASITDTSYRHIYLFPKVGRDNFRTPSAVADMYFLPKQKGKGRPSFRALDPTDEAIIHITELEEKVLSIDPEVIIALGPYTMWVLSDSAYSIRTIQKYAVPSSFRWRGSQETTRYLGEIGKQYSLLYTHSPTELLRNWSLRPDIITDLRRAKTAEHSGYWQTPSYNFILNPTLNDTIRCLTTMLETIKKDYRQGKQYRLSVDLETLSGFIACVGLAWSKTDAICIPFTHNGGDSYWTVAEETTIIELLRCILTQPNLRVIGQNFLYDAQYIAQEWQIFVSPTTDTLITQHLCWPGQPRGLAYLSSIYAEYHQYWKDEGKHIDPTIADTTEWAYNCKDAVITFEIAEVLEKLTVQLNLLEQFEEQHHIARIALRMMLQGVKIDTTRKNEELLQLQSSIAEYESWFNTVIPESIWPVERKRNGDLKKARWWTSTHQQKEIFHQLLGLNPVRSYKAKSGNTLNNAALEKMKLREPLLSPVFQRLQEYRSLQTFGKILQSKLDPDSRMRCFFDVAGTETFRFSSSANAWDRGTNLQNIPSGLDEKDVIV